MNKPTTPTATTTHTVDAFTRKYYKECMRMAMSITNDVEISEDVVQDFLLKLVLIENEEGSIDRIYYNGTPNKVFMYRSIMNRYIDKWRKRKNDPVLYYMSELPEDATPAWSGTEHYESESVHLEEALKLSKEKIHEVIDEVLSTLHWYDEKVYRIYNGLAPYNDVKAPSFRELAAQTGISSTSLWNTCRKVNEKIREAVGPELYAEYIENREKLNQYI